MTAEDFRRIALSLGGAEESAHMGAPDFRVGGRIFATLAHQSQGLGNLMLSPFAQRVLIITYPELCFPVAGGWGRNGATHIRLADSDEAALTEALRVAWTLRCAKNGRSGRRRS